MQHEQEILDIVNENDDVISTLTREEIYEKKLKTFRTINAFLINEKKQLWIPVRSSQKLLWPGHLDASIGGHVQSGEKYDDAFKREVLEETNLKIDDFSWRDEGKLSPFQYQVSCFMKVYLIKTPQLDIDFNKSDFISAQWYYLNEIYEQIASGTQVKPDLPPLLDFIKEPLSRFDI
tara:strand:- start:3154 stop:3684 length:531 start_codon:yes stop_codon:yes gene_type:complete